jgi:peptidyl-prolyl cis-trans isomerase A (cyclophilin A)
MKRMAVLRLFCFLMIYLTMRTPVFFLFLILLAACSPRSFKTKWLKEEAPAKFSARFETTDGIFEIEARREWSPMGVDRLYQLIKRGYFTNTPVYRVIPNFVAQFGGFDTLANKNWEKTKLPDEPVVKSNLKGTLSFARSGKQTRSNQLYINLADNVRLDTSGAATTGVNGFPVIASVTSGMEVVQQFFSYRDEPRQNLKRGADALLFFKEKYPEMDYIKKAYLLKKKK